MSGRSHPCVLCKKRKENHPDIVFHAFPKNKERCMKWVHIVRVPHLQGKTCEELKSIRICSNHFQAKNYTAEKPTSRLTSYALPDQNLGDERETPTSPRPGISTQDSLDSSTLVNADFSIDYVAAVNAPVNIDAHDFEELSFGFLNNSSDENLPVPDIRKIDVNTHNNHKTFCDILKSPAQELRAEKRRQKRLLQDVESDQTLYTQMEVDECEAVEPPVLTMEELQCQVEELRRERDALLIEKTEWEKERISLHNQLRSVAVKAHVATKDALLPFSSSSSQVDSIVKKPVRNWVEDDTEDMTRGRPEGGNPLSRRSSSSNMLSINNEENGVQESHECSLCYTRFPQKALLETHMDEHDEKGYQCNVCNQRFAYKSDLADHMAVQTKEEKYECDLCGKIFTQKSSIKSHMIIHECVICKEKLNCKGNFRKHMKIHIGEKKYKCTLCKKSFNKTTALKSHMHSHSKVKYRDICNKKSKKNSHLRSYLPTKRIHQIYQCHICDKKYNLESVFKRHVCSHNKDGENETSFEYVEILSFVNKETDGSSISDTSENIFDDVCDEEGDGSCTIKSEVDIKTEEYFEEI